MGPSTAAPAYASACPCSPHRGPHARADPDRRPPHRRRHGRHSRRLTRSTSTPTSAPKGAASDRPRARCEALIGGRRFFTRSEVSDDKRSITHATGGRPGDVFYRDRWSHDKVVRRTHGVNCTGSCSWKVYVKDGIITWEAQQTDYPSRRRRLAGVRAPRMPRGAAFSWYTYSPTRVRYPYIRGMLLEMYREAKAPRR